MIFFFLNALVLYFYLEHVQRITFCCCFLIFNQAVFCVDDGVVLWLKKILLLLFITGKRPFQGGAMFPLLQGTSSTSSEGQQSCS